MKTETRATACVLLLALGLRLANLTFQPLWADEGYSVYFASLAPGALVAATAADIHPPLYYLLLKLWMALLGPGEFSLRLLSVFFGVAAVALTYAIAVRLCGRRVALVASVMLALLPFHVYYSQEVRMYSLVGMLALASTMFMLRSLDSMAEPSSSDRRELLLSLVLYAMATALALYTLYYAAFLPLAQTLYVLLRHRRQRRVIARWLAAEALTLVLYLPWLLAATGALATYVGGKVAAEQYAPLDPLSFLSQVFAALAMGAPSSGRLLLAVGALAVLALAGLGLLRPQPPSGAAQHGDGAPATTRWPGALLALLVAVPISLGYVVNLLWPFSPTGFPRLFIYCAPYLLILAAQGAVAGVQTALSDQRRLTTPLVLTGIAAAFAILCLADFYTWPRYARHDYRPLVKDMATLANPNDVVIALYPWQIGFVRSYYPGTLPHLVFIERAAEWVDYPAVMRQDLDRMGQDYGRMWFLSYEGAGRLLETAVSSYLTDASYPALARWFGDHRLLLYSFGDAGPARGTSISVGGAATLESTSASLDPAQAGRDCVRVALRWTNLAALPANAQVGLRLADDSDNSWARRDSKPRDGLAAPAAASDGTVTDHHALPIPATTPPGIYRLLLSVFDSSSNAPLPLSDASGQGLGSEVEIGKVIVTKSSYYPPAEALAIPSKLSAQFVGGPLLLGYRVAASVQPGRLVAIDLYWQAQGKLEEDPVLFVQLQDRANKVWGLYEGLPVGSQYPLSRWTQGEMLRGQVSFLLAPDAPAGDYRIIVGWLKGRSKERLSVAGGGTQVVLAHLTVVPRQHVMTLPQPSMPMDERLGDIVQFLGYDGDLQQAKPGEPLSLTLYWRALARIDAPYVVFVHLVGANGRIWVQRDSEPGGGEVPTTAWLPGEVISDTYRLDLPASMPAGDYTLVLGIYDKATQVRLPVRDMATGQARDVIQLGELAVTQ